MHTTLLCLCFLVEVLRWHVSAAPGCDLKAIFRTPRRNFDELELVERSNFDREPKKCSCRRRKHHEDYEYPRPYANAQVLLRFGSDEKDTTKDNTEPCIPISKLSADDKLAPAKETVPCNQLQYQQNLCQCPYVFPTYLYYNPVRSVCSHLLPLMRELFSKEKDEKLPQESEGVQDVCKQSEDLTPSSSVVDNCENQNDIPKLPEDATPGQDQKVETLLEGETSLDTDREIVEPVMMLEDLEKKPCKYNPKKASEKNSEKGEISKNIQNSNILKLVPNSPDGKVDYSGIIEESSNGKFISLNAIKREDATPDFEKMINITSQEISAPISTSKNCNVTLHLVKIDPHKLNKTYQGLNPVSDIIKLLNEALVPISCSSCNNVTKNVVTYPIFNKHLEENIAKENMNVDSCGCTNSLIDDDSHRSTRKFSADIDDLNLMHGEPITQSSIINNFAPKFLKSLFVAKGLSKLEPLLREPRVTVYKYNRNYEVPEQTPEEPHRCTCNNCQCHLKRALVLQKPTLVIQPEYSEEFRVLPSYLSRQYAKPLRIYEQVVEEIQEPSDEVLVPVTLMHEEERSNRCSCCAPYVGELNE